MTASIDRKLNLKELRKEFDRIYPTAKNLHMNVIASVMLNTDFNEVNQRFSIHYDFYRISHIRNSCISILNNG